MVPLKPKVYDEELPNNACKLICGFAWVIPQKNKLVVVRIDGQVWRGRYHSRIVQRR